MRRVPKNGISRPEDKAWASGQGDKKCAYHVGTLLVPYQRTKEHRAGTTGTLYESGTGLRCPIPGCRWCDVQYNAKPPDEGTRMWNAVGLKGHRDLDWLEVE